MYYFAYGSNLCLEQMAARCPESWYVGRAVLSDYKWQINQRGLANIVYYRGSSVHGLVFELGRGDEARLDRAGGANRAARGDSRKDVYSKEHLRILLYPARGATQMRVQHIVDQGGPAVQRVHLRDQQVRTTTALVYISHRFKRLGEPREEYIDRINHGIDDAVTLGIPMSYFDGAVEPFVPVRHHGRQLVVEAMSPAVRHVAVRPALLPAAHRSPERAVVRFAPEKAVVRFAPEQPVARRASEPVVVRRLSEPIVVRRQPERAVIRRAPREVVVRHAPEPTIQPVARPLIQRQDWAVCAPRPGRAGVYKHGRDVVIVDAVPQAARLRENGRHFEEIHIRTRKRRGQPCVIQL